MSWGSLPSIGIQIASRRIYWEALGAQKEINLVTMEMTGDWEKKKTLYKRGMTCFPNTCENDPGWWRILWISTNTNWFLCDNVELWSLQLWIPPDGSDEKATHYRDFRSRRRHFEEEAVARKKFLSCPVEMKHFLPWCLHAVVFQSVWGLNR